MINVTCGIIEYNDKILISQRSENKIEYPLYWEFPGGKCLDNESITQCLIREIKEELNIDVSFKKNIYIKKTYLNKYNLYYCLCTVDDISNLKINNEINDYKIVNKNELKDMKLIPGDKEIIIYI